jgi:ferredoxin-NADP reductase
MIDATPSPLWSWLPRSWREPFDVARRDVTHVSRRLFGGDIAQTVARAPRIAAPTAARAATVARPMDLVAVTPETDDAVSLTLAPRDGRPVAFEAGQFLTLEVVIEGVAHRRAYSLSSSAADGARLTVTVKRVPGGLISNHLHDTAKVGDTIAVLGPSGSFTVGDAATPRHVVLVAGGSGITPMMSLLRTHLAASPSLRFTLVYGNRDRDHVIFRDALDALAAAHPDRFTLIHALEHAPDLWAGITGRLDEATCARVFDGLANDSATWMLCGPDPMMAAARAALLARGVAPTHLREERFFTPSHGRTSGATEPRLVTIRTKGGSREVTAAPGMTLLDAGLAAGVDMPFSCTMGGCGACRVKVAAGDVALDEPNCLTTSERAAGYTLACCARAVTDVTVEVEP